MQSRSPLPVELTQGPFTAARAKAAGVSLDRLRRIDVVHVSRGLYRPADWDFDLESAARALSAITPGAWISHVTAARLHCCRLPTWLCDSTELHLSKPRILPGVRRKGVIGHEVLAAEGEVEYVDGIWISTRARTWLDMARLLPLKDLICMGDELIRVPRNTFEGRENPHTSVDFLRAMVDRHPNLQGIVHARQALDLMRIGSDSAPESLLRLAMFDAGIPEPQLQLNLRVGDPLSPSADLGFRQRRIAIQYDGGHHLTEPQKLSDRRRDRAFEAAGWTVLVFGREDLADGFDTATKKIKSALRSAWTDPAAASGFARAI